MNMSARLTWVLIVLCILFMAAWAYQDDQWRRTSAAEAAASNVPLEIDVEDYGDVLYVFDTCNEYRETATEFRTRFFTQLKEWCREHNKKIINVCDRDSHRPSAFYGMELIVTVDADPIARPADATP